MRLRGSRGLFFQTIPEKPRRLCNIDDRSERSRYLRDEELIKRIKDKDESAIEELMDAYSRLLFKIGASVLEKAGTPSDVEECVADVFIQIWRRPESFDSSRGSLKAFLSALARNKAIDRFRQLSRHLPLELNDEILGSDPDPAEGMALKERSGLIAEAIEELPPEERDIIVRRFCYGQKPGEISKAMDIPVKRVYNSIQSGKLRLRAGLAERGIVR